MAVPIVKIRGVSKSFGKKQVLNDIHLDINEGEIFGVIGTSGVGKSTLLAAMVGFISVNKGEISFRQDNHGVFNFLTLKQNQNIKKYFLKITLNGNMKHSDHVWMRKVIIKMI